ncbi:MAG: Crp/Fnr family transcriptional regulator [Marivibrio sp.]|uniref:Crp/Fnr family transcriptional regulator n=1 Tax=Marivibrio sp. TaxID=2039719 RepID=UPI0032ED9303
MAATAADASWMQQFPALDGLPAAERQRLAAVAQSITLPADKVVFAPGRPPEHFMLLLEGVVRVQQTAPGGREIVLYRVAGGETCIMTTACLLSHEAYAAEGVTETEVKAVAIPKTAFDDLIATSPGFRQLVFSDYSNRIADLMHVVEEVAFERIDKRLAQKILARADVEGEVAATHQALAVELGTAREVVSRHLKEFQRRGLVDLARGRLRLADREGLRALAEAEN